MGCVYVCMICVSYVCVGQHLCGSEHERTQMHAKHVYALGFGIG